MQTSEKLLTFILLFLCPYLFANNIQVENVTLASKNTADNYYMVEFDLSWENSWRTSTYESNWDAAWVFIKATVQNQQDWKHGYLNYVDGSNDGHSAPNGSIIHTAINNNGNQGIGVFIYRSTDGIGDVNFDQVALRWNYGDSGFEDDDIIDISVTAIEMVYVPEGSFYLGDGMGDFGQFEQGTSGAPYMVNNENSLTLGGGGQSSLGNNNAINMQFADDFNDAVSQTLPADFPKGFDAFYCMKYEASQSQYASFLAHLNETQRSNRTEVIYVNCADKSPVK